MQCINCGFENIPGMDVCVRCQSRLNLGDVAVVPPRASWVHSPTRWRQVWYRFRLTLRKLAAAWDAHWAGSWSPDLPTAVVGSLIPGLGLVLKGAGILGWGLLLVWSALLLMTLGTIGTWAYGYWISGLAVVHALGIAVALRPILFLERTGHRALLGVILFLLIRFGAYATVEWVGRGFYIPLPLNGLVANAILRNGDSVLYDGRWLRPDTFQRGDVVIFRLRGGTFYAGRQVMYYIPNGWAVDRVVGVPGDRVEFIRGALRVNGEPAASYAHPLADLRRYGDVSLTLEPGQYAIFPSTVPIAVYGQVPVGTFIQKLVHVPGDDILGRVVFRLHPWSTFGRVE